MGDEDAQQDMKNSSPSRAAALKSNKKTVNGDREALSYIDNIIDHVISWENYMSESEICVLRQHYVLRQNSRELLS